LIDGEEKHLDLDFEVTVDLQVFPVAAERYLVVSDDCALADDIELEFLCLHLTAAFKPKADLERTLPDWRC
jgi:hypothetical protein